MDGASLGLKITDSSQDLRLAIVDAIATSYGGSVELTPRAEGGLAVTLRLAV